MLDLEDGPTRQREMQPILSKLPDDVRLALDLRAFLEQMMEHYEGQDLERAQNAIRVIDRAGLLYSGTDGAADLRAYCRDCIHAAVERRPAPARPSSLTAQRQDPLSFPLFAFLGPTAGLSETRWEWIDGFRQMIDEAIEKAIAAERGQPGQLRALAMVEAPAVYLEGLRSGALQWRSPREVRDWFMARLEARLHGPEYPPPPPKKKPGPQRPLRRRAPRPLPEDRAPPQPDEAVLASEEAEARVAIAFGRQSKLDALLTPAQREFRLEVRRQLAMDRGLSGKAELLAARRAAAGWLNITPANARQIWRRILAAAKKVRSTA